MKHFALYILAALVLAACSTSLPQQPTANSRTMADSDDTTIYGLVCDGSNDTIIVFLHDPYDGTDPDTLNILEASRAQQVFGALRIGDKVAIIRDTADDKRASLVIVTQDLLGQWCYKVKPTLRRRVAMDSLATDSLISEQPDSIKRMLNTEVEYGVTLKIDSVAMPIGMGADRTYTDGAQLVEFPPLKRYRQWYIRDGKLLLTQMKLDSLGNTAPLSTDTATLVVLTPDTLVLRFPDGEQAYYKKAE